MAGVWTPLYDLATRTLQPRFAGAASGVLSTIQELGAVLATAGIGAVPQNQLATSLREEAASYATRLPAPIRAPFVDGFSGAAKHGFEVGAGQSGTALQLPAGVSSDIAAQIAQIAHAVFTHAFVDAMRPAMSLALAVVFAARSSLFGRGSRGRAKLESCRRSPQPRSDARAETRLLSRYPWSHPARSGLS